MVEAMKIATKTALIAAIMAGIIAIMVLVKIPTLDFSLITQGLSTALAIGYHWCPGLSVVFPVAISMMGVYFAILGFHFATIAVRWIFKVNE